MTIEVGAQEREQDAGMRRMMGRLAREFVDSDHDASSLRYGITNRVSSNDGWSSM